MDLNNISSSKMRNLVRIAMEVATEGDMYHRHGAVLTKRGGNKPITTACNSLNRSAIKGEPHRCSMHAEVACLHRQRHGYHIKGSKGQVV